MISTLKDLPWCSLAESIKRGILVTLVLFMLASFTLSSTISIYWYALGIILINLICLIILISVSQISFFISLLLGLGTYLLSSWLTLYIAFWILEKKENKPQLN